MKIGWPSIYICLLVAIFTWTGCLLAYGWK